MGHQILVPKDEDIDALVNQYIDDQEDCIESDGFIVGMDVTHDQLRDVMLDFATYIKAL